MPNTVSPDVTTCSVGARVRNQPLDSALNCSGVGEVLELELMPSRDARQIRFWPPQTPLSSLSQSITPGRSRTMKK
ncbi:hypothetical protein FQZ97_1056510 [compost metagenome]